MKDNYILLGLDRKEYKIIDIKIRKIKNKIEKLYKMLKNEVDLENSLVDSRILEELTILAKIDEELTEVIYLILDNKNS